MDGKVAALLESRLSDRSALEDWVSFLKIPLRGTAHDGKRDVRMRP